MTPFGKATHVGKGRVLRGGSDQRVRPASPKFLDVLHARTQDERKKNKFCMVIKLDVRKVFTESTTPAMADTDTIVDA